MRRRLPHRSSCPAAEGCLLAFITAPPAGSPMRSHRPEATECRPAVAAAASRASGGALPPLLLELLAPPPLLLLALVPLVAPGRPAAAGPRSSNSLNLRLELPAFSTSSLLRADAMVEGRA